MNGAQRPFRDWYDCTVEMYTLALDPGPVYLSYSRVEYETELNDVKIVYDT